MCGNIPVENGVKAPVDCKCYRAVMRCYAGLLDTGAPSSVALEAAQIVYRYHHPEDAPRLAHLTVERWVQAERTH